MDSVDTQIDVLRNSLLDSLGKLNFNYKLTVYYKILDAIPNVKDGIDDYLWYFIKYRILPLSYLMRLEGTIKVGRLKERK